MFYITIPVKNQYAVISNYKLPYPVDSITIKDSLKNSMDYKAIQKDFPTSKIRLGVFLLTRNFFRFTENLQMLSSFFNLNSPKTSMILKQTVRFGGEITANSKKNKISFKHSLKEKFLKDKKIINFQFSFLETNSPKKLMSLGSLSTDRVNTDSNNKILHISGIFNTSEMQSIPPVLEFFGKSRLFLEKNHLIELKNNIKNYLKGNISLVLFSPQDIIFPPDLKTIDFIMTFGINKNSVSILKKSLERVIRKMFRSNEVIIKKEGLALWKITRLKNFKDKPKDSNRRSLPRENSKRSVSFFFYLKKGEFVVVSDKKYLSILNSDKNSKNIIRKNKKYLSGSAKETSGLVLIELKNIYRLLSRSQLGMMFPQYIDYLKNTDKIIIHSFQKKDDVYYDFGIFLK